MPNLINLLTSAQVKTPLIDTLAEGSKPRWIGVLSICDAFNLELQSLNLVEQSTEGCGEREYPIRWRIATLRFIAVVEHHECDLW